jgi:uncharacterized membrane protein (DUF373 family)
VLKLTRLSEEWRGLTTYQRFERVASWFIMFLICLVVFYSLILIAITLVNQVTGPAFTDTTALKDVFGSILTVLILIEFNHSIAVSLTKRSGVLQARYIVLITIMVVARKVILLDFSSATFQTLAGIGIIALAMGVLYWLVGVRSGEDPADPRSYSGGARER